MTPTPTARAWRPSPEAFPAEIFPRFAGAGSRAAAPIFVVGMPRSGSTLIEQILSSHPAIHGAGELPAMPQIAAEKPECRKASPR